MTEFQQKVEAIKQEAATEAAQLKSQVSQQLQNKAFIGSASAIANNQLTIQNAKSSHTVKVDQYTVYQDTTSKKAMTFNDIKTADFLVCLGDVDDSGNLLAKKIIRQKAAAPENKVAVWGQLQSILINTLSLLKNDGQKLTINTDSNTSLVFGNQEITVSNLKVGNYIIAVGDLSGTNLSTQFIDLLNLGGSLKISTASASPSAVASAKPSPGQK